VKISFHGADRNVTGSCHLVECGGARVVVDCGLFQGGRALERENAQDVGFDPAGIDVVLLTHAHLDHCGRLPLLTRRGFRGEIITTSATRELARLILLDSAHILEEDARRRSRRRARRRGEDRSRGEGPLFSVMDALETMDRFGRAARYGDPVELADGIRATFVDAGHILGSASIRLDLEESGRKRSVLFSGDLGNPGRPLLPDPGPPPASEVVVMETTYGDREHRSPSNSAEELWGAVSETVAGGGNVVIPTFALERAQEILYDLRRGMDEERIPPGIQVFLDSPLAISITDVYRRHPECLDPAALEGLERGEDPFSLPGLRMTRESAESRAINDVRSGAVILAGSGMCTGGRVRHHLKHNLWREACSVVFVGFAASGTLARTIIDGAESVRIFGEEMPVRARIHTINGYSAHADRDQLLAWHGSTGADRTFLVHGEEEVMEGFAALLEGTRVEMPARGRSVEL